MEFPDEEVARYWDENASSWTEQVRRGWDVYREHYNNPAFFHSLGDVKGKRVLDAGCGEGHNTRLLARLGAEVVGVDISPRMIELARREEEERPLGIRYQEASFSHLSVFHDESFDMVISFMALMDAPAYTAAVREVYRVLRTDGHLVFSVTHPCFMTRGFGWVQDEAGHPRALTVSRYFDREPWLERWGFSGALALNGAATFAVLTFPKTLSDYFNTLMSSGFLLAEVEEPRVPEEALRLHPYMYGWREHAPLFLYVRAEKPG